MVRIIPRHTGKWKKTLACLLLLLLCTENSIAVTGQQTADPSPAVNSFSEQAQEWLEQEPKETRLMVQGEAGLEEGLKEGISIEPQRYGDLSIYTFASEQDAARAYEFMTEKKGLLAEFDFIYETSEQNNNTEVTADISETEQSGIPLPGSQPVTVAVIDTGADTRHPLLKNRIKKSLRVTEDDPIPEFADINGHGTNVASIIAENTPENVSLLSIQAADTDGRSTASALYLGIRQAMQEQADIINISMNGLAGRSSKLVEEAVRTAVDSGITVIVSAGNQSGDTAYYSPADLSGPVVVGSVDSQKSRSQFSNTGVTLDFVSDGENIAVQNKEGEYQFQTGTSYAAALVTAVAARIKSAQIGIPATELEQELARISEDLGDPGWDAQYGWGYLSPTRKDAEEEVNEAEEEKEKEPTDPAGRNLSSTGNWRDLDDTILQELYANSTMEQISSFLQTNAVDKEVILERIPALRGKIRGNNGMEDAYSFFERQETGAYAISAGRDLGNSFSGYFWFYLSCDGYYRPARAAAEENHVQSWYKIHVYNVSYKGTENNSNSGSSNQRKYQVAVEKIFQNGSPSSDYFDFTLSYNQSGSSDYGTRLESSSAESVTGTTSYSVYRIYASYLQREYHRADFGLVNWYIGKRLNTREYDISNAANRPNTLDESSYPISDSRQNFVIQIHNGNTGQASRFDNASGSWVDDKKIHAVARLRMFPAVINAESSDYIHGGDFHGTRIGSSGPALSRTYPATGVRGADWGTESTIPGYHYISDTMQDYYGGPHRKLEAARYFSPNAYQISYEGGPSSVGNAYSTSHLYDTWGNLKGNQFSYPVQVSYQMTEDGRFLEGVFDKDTLLRPFLAWNYLGVSYQPGQPIRNLTSSHNAVVTMQAVWGFANGIALPASSAFRRGYSLSGWKAGEDVLIRPGQDFQSDRNMILKSVWAPGVFRIKLDPQGGEANPGYTRQIYQKFGAGYYRNAAASEVFKDQQIVVPGKTIPDASLPDGKSQMKFMGYYTEPEGAGIQVIGPNGDLRQSINNSAAHQYFAADSTVYAFWKEQKKITFVHNLTDKDMQMIGESGYQMPENFWGESGTASILEYQPAAVTNASIKEMYRFLGWSLSPEVQSSDEIILSTELPRFTFDMSRNLILYGQWDSSYKLAFMGNEQTEGSDYLKDVNYFRDEYLFPGNEDDYFLKSEYRPTIDIETGKETDKNGKPVEEEVKYSFQGWSMFYDKDVQLEKFIFKPDNLGTDAMTFLKYAKEASVIESGIGVTYGVPSKYYNKTSEYHNINLQQNNENFPYINMFAVWDQYPQILASDLYIPLNMAQNGEITENSLLDLAVATDKELINPTTNPKGQIKLGVDSEAGTSFRIIDYTDTDFLSVREEQALTITYQAIDKAENIVNKMVTVYLVNTNGIQKIKPGVRFISKKHVDTISRNSIWNSGKYKNLLFEVLNNKKNNQKYTEVPNPLINAGAVPKIVPGSGEWADTEQIWMFSKSDITEVKKFVDQYGLGNKITMFLQKFAVNKIY